jgi:hypothetical protein
VDSAPKSASEVPPDASLQLAAYLWEEYKYRHDLIWRLLFRLTAVAAVLSIVPFTINDSVREYAGFSVNLVPAVALGLIAGGWKLLLFEWKLFVPVNEDYRKAQKRARQGLRVQEGGHARDPDPREQDMFKLMVYVYPGILLGLAAFVSLLVWF